MEYITAKVPAEPEVAEAGRILTSYLRGHKNELNRVLESIYTALSSRIGALEAGTTLSAAGSAAPSFRSGESGGWSWRIYSDGTAECWGRFTREGVKCSTKWGSIFISEDCEGEEFPFEFESAPVLSIGISGTGSRGYLLGHPSGEGSATAQSTGRWWFCRGTASDTEDTVQVDIFARGRVKK